MFSWHLIELKDRSLFKYYTALENLKTLMGYSPPRISTIPVITITNELNIGDFAAKWLAK